MDKKLLGNYGERAAAEYLAQKGYNILERNFKCKTGEIDIIAQTAGFIVFAEVKLRKNSDFGEAREFVTRSKQLKIMRTAQYWISVHKIFCQPRFDVIEVYAPDGVNSKENQISHIINAYGLNY